MHKRWRIILIILLSLIAIGGIVGWQRESLRLAYAASCRTADTVALPRCDRVEVCRLDGKTEGDAATGFPIRPYDSFSQILEHKTLKGQDAEAVAALWRSQTFGSKYQAMCHEPGYGLRFYRGSSLKFETSICFNCSNFYVAALGKSNWWGFDLNTLAADALADHLQRLFPDSPSKPEK